MQRKMSLRAIENAEIILDDVFVPDDEHLKSSRDFASGLQPMFKHSRLYVAWLATGMAASACEAAFAYTKQRKQFGKPVAAR